MWVGIMLMCMSPSALSCQVIAKPEAFYTEQSCLEEAAAFADDLRSQGVYAVPACVKIGTST